MWFLLTRRRVYQTISYKDIPNLFHCSATNCSVVDLLSNQKCRDSPGWTVHFPSWPMQQLPDVVFPFTAAMLFWHLCCTSSPAGWPFMYKTAFHTSDYSSASSRIESTALPRQLRVTEQLNTHLWWGAHAGNGSGSQFMLNNWTT